MLFDIILLLIVILILFKIYINNRTKEHMSTDGESHMDNKNESQILGKYYGMLNNNSITEEEKCHINNKIITELNNNAIESPKLYNLAKDFKSKNCHETIIPQKEVNDIHVLGDTKPIVLGQYSYSLYPNNNSEPELIRKNTVDLKQIPLKSNASLIIKFMDNVYSFNTQNNKWYVDKNNSWTMITDNTQIGKLEFFVNELTILRSSLNKTGSKLININPIFHINNDIFPIKKTINSEMYEYSIINGKLVISNKTLQKLEDINQDALVLLLLNDNIYILSQSFNWILVTNNTFQPIHNSTTINDLNNLYNTMIKRKSLINNLENPVLRHYENLYYLPSDNIPLYIKNDNEKLTSLYLIDNNTYSIIKTDKDSNKTVKLQLEFITIMVYDSKIYFKTKAGSWVSDKSTDNNIKLQSISDAENKNIDSKLLYYMTENKEASENYYESTDKKPFKYNEFRLTLQNGYFVKDIDGLLYVKFPNQDYLKFIRSNYYEMVQPDKLQQIKSNLNNRSSRFANFKKLGISVYNKGDNAALVFNNYNYKINNNNFIEKNNMPFLTIFSLLLNMHNVLYSKGIDGIWYQEKNDTIIPLNSSEYTNLNTFLVKSISLRNMGIQMQTKGQVPNLQTCSKSAECINNNAYCREGNNLCMFDDECNFMYRDKNISDRTTLCKKMPKHIEWFTFRNDSPLLLSTMQQERVLTKIPNSLYDNKNIKLCNNSSLGNTKGCINITGIHNVYIFLNILKQIASSSNDRDNAPGFVTIIKESDEKYSVVVYSWPLKSPLSDIIHRSNVYTSIKNKSIDNTIIENDKIELILLSI